MGERYVVLISRLAEQLLMILRELLMPCLGHRCLQTISHNVEMVHRDHRPKSGKTLSLMVKRVAIPAAVTSSTAVFPFFFRQRGELCSKSVI